jgi:hypothetical protein
MESKSAVFKGSTRRPLATRRLYRYTIEIMKQLFMESVSAVCKGSTKSLARSLATTRLYSIQIIETGFTSTYPAYV